jgi:tetratricopeptide (TPR) repeat protein
VAIIVLGFLGGMGYWYIQIKNNNDEVNAANTRLETFNSGRSSIQAAVTAGNYQSAVDQSLALQGAIELTSEEQADILAMQAFADFKLAETAIGATRLNDLLASRDAYLGVITALNGVQDGRYASACFSLGGVYYALADFQDKTANLQQALAYYQKVAAYTGTQDPAVKAEAAKMITYIQDHL